MKATGLQTGRVDWIPLTAREYAMELTSADCQSLARRVRSLTGELVELSKDKAATVPDLGTLRDVRELLTEIDRLGDAVDDLSGSEFILRLVYNSSELAE